MHLLKVLLPLFLFVNTAHAQPLPGGRCESLFRPITEQSVSAGKSSFQARLSNVLESAQVPENIKNRILDSSARDIEVRIADIQPDQIKLKRKFGLLRSATGSKERFVLTWPSESNLTAGGESIVNLKIAEVAGAILFKPVTRLGVYKVSSRNFVNENLDALTYKLYLENFATPRNSPSLESDKSAINRILGIVLRKLLPLQKTELTAARLDQTYARLFEQGGPSAVYSYLSKFYSIPMAISYWVRHVMNGGVAIAVTLALYLAPTATDAWHLMRKEGSISISESDRALAQGIIENFDKTDIQMIQAIKRDASDSQEAQILKDFASKYKDEQNATHP
ncbi:MAG: hypothetical protein JNJ49_08565 [Bdellovibrionaceae bacterium]|nr:hypothetical protein [Pseudobdellovibrionaceae bacterium]